MKSVFHLLFILIVISCSSPRDQNGNQVVDKPTIAVVNYPLYFFAKSIVGDMANVYLPAIGGDPAYWKPSAKQVIAFQKADLILANGAGYAKWMEKISLPTSKIINTSASYRNQLIETDELMVHSHGPEGEHSHKGTAITTWLNFKFAQPQATIVYESIIKLLPKYKDEFDKNFKQLVAQLDGLDKKMVSISDNIGDQSIIASHPVYQYLESGYGIRLINMHWEPDEMPEKEEWDSFAKLVVDNKANVMIWEDNPIDEIRVKLDELNIKLVVFNPCANKPENGNFMDIMEENLHQFETSTKAM